MDTTIQRCPERKETGHRTGLTTRIWSDESAVTAIEYGLLAALIAVAIVGAISATGDSMGAMYDYWSTAVITALGG
jgi:pilus assembly protein Flp/PilA